MTAAMAQAPGVSGAQFSTPLIGLIVIAGLIAGALMLSHYAGRLRPLMRSMPYIGAMIAALVLGFGADALAIGIPGGVFLAIFVALLAARIVVELAAPARPPARRVYNASNGQSDGGTGGYSPGPSGSGRRNWDDADGGHGGDGGGNGGGGGGGD